MKDAAAALPYPMGKGTKGSFLLFVGRKEGESGVQGGDKHRIESSVPGCSASCP